MTHKDEAFEFYQLPYRHNIRNYARFNNNTHIDYNINDYFVYLISIPISHNDHKTNNNYTIKAAILVKNKSTGELTLNFEEFDFKSILELNTFSRINSDGSTALFEEGEKKFSNKLREQELNIIDTEDFEILTLADVANRFNILNKVDIHKYDGFKNLEYYLYNINGKQVLIPATEILKYFYLFNYQNQTTSHFCSDILTPNGIMNSLNKPDIDSSTNHYKFTINGDYSIKDRYKILFFITNQKRLSMYSNVFKTYKSKNKISASFPRKSVELKVRTFDYKDKNLLLVLNILKHDNNGDREFPYKFTYEYEHAKSKLKEKDKGKKDKSKDIHKKKCKNDDLNSDDSKYGNNELEYDEETQNNFKQNIEYIKVETEVKLDGKKVINDQREQKGGKLNKEATDKNIPKTTKGTSGNQENAVSEQNNEEEKDKKEFKVTINEIINHIKEEKDFNYIGYKNYIYPMVFNDQGKIKKAAFIFTDKKQKIRRKYNIALLKYKTLDVYIIELEPQLNGSTKSILSILLQGKNIDYINDSFIEKELVDFINSSNRSWLTGNISLNKINYFTLRHTGSISSFSDKLTNHYKKYFK